MRQPTVLIVDDNPDNLQVLGELLQVDYRVLAARSGERALQLARRHPAPELVLLDLMMPLMDGHQVLQALRDDPATCDIPVIFATAMDSTDDERHGLAEGAVDYITKPLRPAVVLARVRTHLALKQARDSLRDEKAALQAELLLRRRENERIQDVAMRALARLAETRDNETGNHLLRTQAYVEALARRAGGHPRFRAELDEHAIALIAKSAPLHDIGKVGIPDRVLLKPGPLTPDEWAVMKTHARLGADAIAHAVADTHAPAPFLSYACEIALHHHERWDGSGYPDGLAGDAIPLAARLMAVADVFDALISRRVYKSALGFGEVRCIMAAQRGRHFDPDLLDAFLADFDAFCTIAQCHPDEPEPVHDGVPREPVAA
ncbi:two-component system response regulator [Rhizobacter sp. SG703]|uniref:HD-GYP domain-containing protein n=1 Tax=Rhizobacter sp. SG703 TaxID=2587140 RepID=UPI001446C1B0|nr:two-component system response regulator [Rhizobacter sp. SG703]NKI94183.1 putative two-component system response regulator [Rhizobacter sp. SG703]